ncbi:hypothetical protein V1L54_16455 [Streptomyces sp. TRM 70361]|uniref:hypothetical protein n=1 Tax=Streptomyces sp. TRM 70361 TaxID=3116553 RepID=UPI002E7B7B56|nr:hypothetical protein [Streptomyces sp. TRM 70361]MEE1940976.1 hypothetical protein [Streptomyces sp. TRM 70361]
MFGTRRKQAPPDGPFYKQRGWINSAAFLGVLVAVSLLALVTGGKGADITAGSQEALAGLSGPLSPGDPHGVRSGPDGRPENCRTDDGDTARPTTAPADVRWRKLVVLMVPTSPSAGPLRTGTAPWWCFARTPLGAVLAAHIIPVQLSGAGWRAVAEQQLVPGKARDRFVISKTAQETSSEESAVGRFTGFSLTSYSGDSATVRLLVTNPIGGHLSTSVSVRWRDGDWKVVPRDDGSLYSLVRRAEPGGFVLWGA